MTIKNRRRTLIVNKIQYRFITLMMGLIIGVSAILVAVLFFIFRIDLFVLGKCYFVQFALFIIIALILYLINLKLVFHLSNKIYGPIYRLSQYIQKLSNGERTGELTFRKGDAINGLKQIYNDLHQSLEKTLHYDYQEMVKIFTELEDVLDQIYNKKISEKELYDSLQSICGRIAKALDITSETIKK